MESTSQEDRGHRIAISPRTVFRLMCGVALGLTALSLTSLFLRLWGGPKLHYLERLLTRLFHTSLEQSVSTWYASATLLTAAAILATIALSHQGQARRQWGSLSLLFIFLSCDEVACLHEQLSAAIRMAVGGTQTLHLYWIPVACLLLLVLWWWYRPFLRRLPRPLRHRLWLAAALYLGGALGLEAVAGLALLNRSPGLASGLLSNLEELLEMLGVAVFVAALLGHVAERRLGVEVAEPGARTPPSTD